MPCNPQRGHVFGPMLVTSAFANLEYPRSSNLLIELSRVLPVTDGAVGPPQKQQAIKLNQIQTKMCLIVQNLRPFEGEDLIGWSRRRWKCAHKLAAEQGLWSVKWFNRALRWDEHLERHPNHVISPLRIWRGRDWLMQQRQSHMPAVSQFWSRLTSFAGRTGTRAYAGCVHKRWHDGVAFAAETLDSSSTLNPWAGLQQLLSSQQSRS